MTSYENTQNGAEGMARGLEGTSAKIVNLPSIFSFFKDEAFSHLI